MKNNDSLDICKWILSLFVVAIHTCPFPEFFNPILATAVPMFFAISGYLFFLKERQLSESEKVGHLKKFFIRSVKLYGFYFVLLIPVIVVVRRAWFMDGFLRGCGLLLFNLVFDSTFPASWFLSALVLGMGLIWFLNRYLNNLILVAMTLVVQIVVELFVMNGKTLGLWSLRYSFPSSVFWIVIGKLMAESESASKINFGLVSGGFVVSLVLLYIEASYVFGWWKGYFSLILVVPLALAIVLRQNVHFRWARLCRNVSTITYTIHGSIVFCLYYFFKQIGHPIRRMLLYLLVIICTYCFAALLLTFSRYRKWRVLSWGC